jgi:two-component system OmpR family response regulator
MYIKVLHIEDDWGLADMIRENLPASRWDITHADNGVEGLSHLLTGQFDVCIADIELPELNGLRIIEQARKFQIHTPILVLSGHSQPNDRLAGLRSGGNDYLTKPFLIEELLLRLEKLLRSPPETPEPAPKEEEQEHYIMRFANLSLNLRNQQAYREDVEIELRPKELELLHYFLLNSERVISKAELLQAVWGYDFDPGTRLVDNHISLLRRKIDQGFTPRLLHTKWGAGYIFTVRP